LFDHTTTLSLIFFGLLIAAFLGLLFGLMRMAGLISAIERQMDVKRETEIAKLENLLNNH
jgi:ABC-type amino acid transport system permease subunit